MQFGVPHPDVTGAYLNELEQQKRAAEKRERGGAVYGKRIAWTDRNGSKHHVDARWYETPEDANKAALRLARGMGWAPPRWWQWWRWRDTRL